MIDLDAFVQEGGEFAARRRPPGAPAAAPARWSLAAEVGEPAHLYLYDTIGGFGIAARDVVGGLREIPTARLVVHLNSPGGDVFDGLAIYNSLRRRAAPVEIRVEGLAASIASLIAMGGSSLRMAAASLLMIHEPHAVVIGTAGDMRSMAALLDKAGGIMAEVYGRRGATRKQVEDWMREETWFTAQSALDAGLIDAIDAEPVPEDARAAYDLSAFKHAPVIAAAAPPRPPRARDGARIIAEGFDLLLGRAAVVIADFQLDAFDPTQHPRHDKGVREGGRFRKKDDAGTATSDDDVPHIVRGITPTMMDVHAYGLVEGKYFDSWNERVGPDPKSDKDAEEQYGDACDAELDELKQEPLVHATSSEAAAQIWDEGELRSRAAMGEDIAEAEEEVLAIVREHLPAGREHPPTSLRNLNEADIAHVPEPMQTRVRGLVDIAEGTTLPADKRVGLDRYVFAQQGRKAQGYGAVSMLIDNSTIDTPGFFATPEDIVGYASGSNYAAEYHEKAITQYRQETVTDGGYFRAAAAGRAGQSGKDFELKLPDRIPKSKILGFIVENPEDYDRLTREGSVPPDRVYYLPNDIRGYQRRFGVVAKHFQREGSADGLPPYEDIP